MESEINNSIGCKIPTENIVIEKRPFKARGIQARLPHGGLPEVISPHLVKLIEKTGGDKGPIGLQFIAQSEKEQKFQKLNLDPLMEDHHEILPGLVYKYKGEVDANGKVIRYGRVLWTITRFCASYCRFCTRGREVGIMPFIKSSCSKAAIANKVLLSDEDIISVFKFLKEHKEINEVIISGGDPLTTPEDYFTKIINGLSILQKNGDIDIIRIGSRLPVHNPHAIKEWHYSLLSEIKNPHLMVHINHPEELTVETLRVLNSFRKLSHAIIFSQSVLLKGVNDSEDILFELFNKLAIEGVRPYYVFQNDDIYWAKHFTVPVSKAIKIWSKLRPRLSGIAATARFVIDVPYGYGKIPLPEGDAWNVDYSKFIDFQGNEFIL